MDQDNGVILLRVPAEGEVTHEWFSTFSGREVEYVSIYRVWISGDHGFGFDEKEHLFVPSFDSKETGVYITYFVHEKEDGNKIFLSAKYDHNTGTGCVKGDGFDNVVIRIKLKPKVE